MKRRDIFKLIAGSVVVAPHIGSVVEFVSETVPSRTISAGWVPVAEHSIAQLMSIQIQKDIDGEIIAALDMVCER